MTEKQDNLESFASRIETRIKAGLNGTDSMERLICRLLVSKKPNPKIQAFLATKWVEWKYGKARETLKVEGTIRHENFDTARLTPEEREIAKRLVESARVGNDS